MQDAINHFFISLFKEAFKKCFGIELHTTLSETECKHFSNAIMEETGLVIGAKSLKNYSFYVLNSLKARQEKPSVATLDTLARYVLNADYTDEIQRKEKEAHYPYWYQYRTAIIAEKAKEPETAIITDKRNPARVKTGKWIAVFIAAVVVSILFAVLYFFSAKKDGHFTDDFHNVQEDALKNNGWILQSEDKTWWNKRNVIPLHLSLYTLHGDNWTDSVHAPVIKNLLLRKISANCFTAEVHLDNFVPLRRWQQAGILLLEDTTFSGNSLRLSIGYNDFFGGYKKPKEIIVQGISSNGSSISNPEEIIHLPLFSIESDEDSLVTDNLKKSALRIEKNGNHFRFLYATGRAENFAFKEILNKELVFQPKYIGIFALGGFVSNTDYIPAHFKYFNLIHTPCTE